MEGSRRVRLAMLSALVLLAGCGGRSLHSEDSSLARHPSPSGTTLPSGSTGPALTIPDVRATTSTTLPVPHIRPTTTTTPPTTVARATLQTALAQLQGNLRVEYRPGTYSMSTVQQGAAGSFVVVGRDLTTTQSVIDVDVYSGGSFRTTVTVGGTNMLDPVADAPIEPTDITGGAAPDFLVLLQGSQGGTGVILSEVTGTWRILGLDDRTGSAASVELIDPRLVGTSYVTQAIPTCGPGCATGQYEVTTYGYDPVTGKLGQVGTTVQQSAP